MVSLCLNFLFLNIIFLLINVNILSMFKERKTENEVIQLVGEGK